ncbi:MAG: hypothetical protein AAF713_19100 [Pseudomonadota bacterium]
MSIPKDGNTEFCLCPTCGQALQVSGQSGGPVAPTGGGLGSDDVPGSVLKALLAVILTRGWARSIGLALYQLVYVRGIPRAKLVDWLHHQVDLQIDQGLMILREVDFSVMDFHDDYLDEIFGDDPSFYWVSSFAKRCQEHVLKRWPRSTLYERLARLDLALRAVSLL